MCSSDLRMDLETRAAADVKEAKQFLKDFEFDLCLTDMRLPDGNGIDLVRDMQETHPDLPVAVITAYGNMETAVDALKAGAFDFVSKPLDINDLRNIVRSALRVNETSESSSKTKPGTTAAHRMLGVSEAINKVRSMIEKLSRGQAPVYISGDSGTGKELAAKLIHDLGPRANKPFIAINCGAVPEALMESEFFGHKRGSFTGAIQDKLGLFQAADGGTLFLDEVGDLPLHMQVKLLRAIQEKTVRPIGAQTEARVDIRVLSATHRNLQNLVKEGKFRQDLYYRLNVIELMLPGLRERSEDVPGLAEFLIQKLAENHGIDTPEITDKAMSALKLYDFPGNVRELENILERAITLCESGQITIVDLQLPATGSDADEAKQASNPAEQPASTTDEPLEDYIQRVERSAIEEAMDKAGQNKTAAAKILGITFRALRYKLEKLGIE